MSWVTNTTVFRSRREIRGGVSWGYTRPSSARYLPTARATVPAAAYVFCVNSAERFIHQNNLRVHRKGPGNGNPLVHPPCWLGYLLQKFSSPTFSRKQSARFSLSFRLRFIFAFLMSKTLLFPYGHPRTRKERIMLKNENAIRSGTGNRHTVYGNVSASEPFTWGKLFLTPLI